MRYILHCDLNNFYASVECLLDETLVGVPVCVCGRVEDRHGVVLAKNMIAKKLGIKTGMTLFEARRIVPDLVIREARHDVYLKYSKAVKDIYREYTDCVESFGIDEAWLDISAISRSWAEAEEISHQIRERVKKEIGLTISVGVSFNKVFAKLGSDMKKPDAVTVIDDQNFRRKIWALPVEELLYVGRATKRKLNDLTIKTIGDLATFDKKLLKWHLGKWGEVLHSYAVGEDSSEVKRHQDLDEIKSVGNSITYYRDIKDDEDIYALLILLAESVVSRMIDYGYSYARTITLTIITNELMHITRMETLTSPTNLSCVIAEKSMGLFKKNFCWSMGLVRGLGVSISNFTNADQVCLFDDYSKNKKLEKLERAVENLRMRFGRHALSRGIVLKEKKMEELNIRDEHTVFPKM